MLTRRFEQLFERLLSRFLAYDDAPRTADRVTELAAARTELDEIRGEIAAERVVVHRRMQRARADKMTTVSDHDIAVMRVRGMISN